MREIGDAALPGGHRALQRRRGMGEAPQDAQHGEYEYGDANPLMPCVVLKFEWWKARDTGHHPAQGKASVKFRACSPFSYKTGLRTGPKHLSNQITNNYNDLKTQSVKSFQHSRFS